MKVTKYKSQNLLGETPKEEDKRLLKGRIKAILAGKDRAYVKEMKRGGTAYLVGTTAYQRKRRNLILEEVGLINTQGRKGGKYLKKLIKSKKY